MEKPSELSDKTMIKIPIPLAITLCLGLIGFGGGYYKINTSADTVINIKKDVEETKSINRKEHDEIKTESENDDEKMEARFMHFMKAEIDGLRADWERDRVEQNRRLIKLEEK